MTILDLTKVARVAARIKPGASSLGIGEDTLLGYLITGVSAQFEQYLGRKIIAESVIEYLDVEPGQKYWRLSAFPVTEVVGIHFSPDQSWTATTLLVFDDEFLNPKYDASGLLVAKSSASFNRTYSENKHSSLRVEYTGGMADTTDNLIAFYPDIAVACEIQVAHHYKRRDAIGTTSVGGPAPLSINAVGLLPEVTAILDAYINPAEL